MRGERRRIYLCSRRSRPVAARAWTDARGWWVFLAVAVLGVLAAPQALAQSTSENSVDLTFTLTGATFEASGLPAQGGADFGGFEQTEILVEDQNVANFAATVVQQTVLDSGTLQLLINAAESDSAAAALHSRVTNNVVINAAPALPVPLIPASVPG